MSVRNLLDLTGRVAIVTGGSRGIGATIAEVGDRSGRLANVLAALTSEPGARVAILLRNRLEYVECDFAIARAGMVKVPINPRLSDDERRYLLADSGASVLITMSVRSVHKHLSGAGGASSPLGNQLAALTAARARETADE